MKVLCINDRNNWFHEKEKLIHKSYLWGLYSKTTTEPNKATGPAYGDICVVFEQYQSNNCTFYKLVEWGQCGFISTAFMPIQEETIEEKYEALLQKGLAIKKAFGC